MTNVVNAVDSGRSRSTSDISPRFALGMAVAMLLVNLIGFAPTFYLRAGFSLAPIPGYLYAHGILGTAWFAFVIMQARLITVRNVALHRQLGWIGVSLAVMELALGYYTSSHMVSRHAAIAPLTEADIRLFGIVAGADLAGFIIIPGLLACAIAYRHRMDIHMRLMLLVTLGMLGPANARIAAWFGEIPNPVIGIIVLSFIGAIVVHDLRTLRRVHKATLFGVLFYFGVLGTVMVTKAGAAIVAQRVSNL
jgi:hypothetical protein